MKLKEKVFKLIVGQAQASYPEEAGGLLLGKVVDGKLDVEMVLPLANIRKESRHNRIEFDPLDYIKAERIAAKHDLGVWGFYHAHPDADAIPSEYDRVHFPFVEWWYPIVSVRKGEFAELRCWRLQESRESFDEINIEICSEEKSALPGIGLQ